MKKIKVISAILVFVILSTFTNVCLASANINEALYNENTETMTLRVTGLGSYVRKEASIAMFDSKNPLIPVYFAQTKVDGSGEINYSYIFRMPTGRECDEYSVKVNVNGAVTLTKKVKSSVYDKDCKVYIEDLKYSIGGGAAQSLSDENVSQLYNKDANISFNLVGMGAAHLSTAIIAALKVDGELNFFQPVYSGNIDYEQTIPLNFDIESYPEDAELEIYAWDGLINNNPLRTKFTVKQEDKITLSLADSDEKIYTNPGKGFLRYGTGFSDDQSAGVMEYASAGYWRYSWADIEPSEGVYNWDRIDNDINYWKLRGKGFAFGVMCANAAGYTQNYVTPKWVFDAGAEYTETTLASSITQYTPVWDDPIFLAKLTNFVNALAARYDGNDNIEFIDIRSCGNYGEMHVGNLNSPYLETSIIKTHVDIYANAFEDTQLMMCVVKRGDSGEIAKYAVAKGIGLRNDGMANNVEQPALTLDAKHNTPVALELATSYATLKSNASNIISGTNDDRVWNDQSYVRGFELTTPNYMDLGQYDSDSDLFITDKEAIIQDLADRMGYKFALKNIKLPKVMRANQSYNVTTAWENSGVSYLYNNCNIALAIIDGSQNVLATAWLDGTNANSFAPGAVTVCNDTFRMGNVAGGSYTLAIGLFRSKESGSPDFKICNVTDFTDRWYPVANINVAGGKYTISEKASVSDEISDIPSYPAPSSYVADGELIGDYQITQASQFKWTGFNGAYADFYSGGAYSGSYCGRMSFRNGTQYGAMIDITERLRANGPGTYKMTGYFKADAQTGITLYLGRKNGLSYYTLSTSYDTINSLSWKKIEQTFTVTASDITNMAQASFLITGRDGAQAGSTSANIYFDDVKITKQ